MSDFYKKLDKYVRSNKLTEGNIIAPHMKYGETTILSSDVALELYFTYQQLFSVQALWEKEKDYCRLLRMENSDMKSELEELYESAEESTEFESTGTRDEEYVC